MLRCAQHDRFQFFNTFRGFPQIKRQSRFSPDFDATLPVAGSLDGLGN
jgi:hypothetical protein